MIPQQRRRQPQTAIGAWTLAVAAWSCAALSQPSPSGAGTEQRLAAQIAATQSADGPYSIDLLDPLASLADIYDGAGDRALALATRNQALQVVRANRGLYSLDQAPLLRASIRTDEAAGDATGAWNLEQGLLALARRNRDDLRAADIFREIGDRRMNLLRRYVAGEYPPEIVLGCYYAPGNRSGPEFAAALDYSTSCTAGSRSVVIHSILLDAWRNYRGAIRVMVEHGMYSSQELHGLEMLLIQSGYQYGFYELGRQSYERLITYNAANGASWLDKCTTAVEMADWQLLYQHYSDAADLYEQCYALLVKKQVPSQDIAALFAPAVPIALPTFVPNPLVSTAPPNSDAYIDVTFDVDMLGDARRVRIAGSKNASREAKRELLHVIGTSHFRPRIANGAIERKSPIALRYHLDDAR